MAQTELWIGSYRGGVYACTGDPNAPIMEATAHGWAMVLDTEVERPVRLAFARLIPVAKAAAERVAAEEDTDVPMVGVFGASEPATA